MKNSLWCLIVALGLVVAAAVQQPFSIAEEPSTQAPSTSPPPAPNPPGPLEYKGVVEVEGASKDQLYRTAVAWFGLTFASSKDVLQVQDREGGMLLGRALFQYEPIVFIGSLVVRGVVRYTIQLEFKDGRYRYTIGSFIHEGTPYGSSGPVSYGLLTTDELCPYHFSGPTRSGREKTWTDLKAKARLEADTLVRSLQAKMATAASQSDDW